MSEWDRAEPITFTLHTDNAGVRRVIADRFPDVVIFDGAFLDQVNPHDVHRDLMHNTITIDAANGRAVYGIVAFWNDAYLCTRLEPADESPQWAVT